MTKTASEIRYMVTMKDGGAIAINLENYEAAVEQGKRYIKNYPNQTIWKSIAAIKAPVPEAEVTELA